jgi:hypothetical protein
VPWDSAAGGRAALDRTGGESAAAPAGSTDGEAGSREEAASGGS